MVALAFGMWWFTPWRLFVDTTVDEAIPTAVADAVTTEEPSTTEGASDENATTESVETTTAPAEPTVLAEGSFISHEHSTTGTAKIIELADGRRILRFEGLDTSNGPELVAALSDGPVLEGLDGWYVFNDHRLVVLGDLKGNIGNQNYEIPADVDLDGLTAAVIWCDRFDVSFGAATLSSTR